MNTFNLDDFKMVDYEPNTNDKLISEDYTYQENIINQTFYGNNLDIKIGFSKEDTNTSHKKLLIDQFKNIIDLEDNLNFSGKIKTAKASEEIKNKNNKKKFGRKRKRNNEDKLNQGIEESDHNKFSDDNLRRKCKHLVLKYALIFINNKIKDIYNGNIGNGILRKELKTINHFQKYNIKIDFNKEFLTKTLGDIFSDDITRRFAYVPLNHNKMIINYLMNEKDENKRIYFYKLFHINFMECLNHFIGKDFICELKGLKCLEEIKKDEILDRYPLDGEEYFKNLFFYLDNYEEIINSKKPRYRKK